MSHFSKWKRGFASFLALCLMLSMMPATALADNEPQDTAEGKQVEATEIEGLSRLETLPSAEEEGSEEADEESDEAAGGVDALPDVGYSDEDTVIAIVQLEAAPVLDSFASAPSVIRAGDQTTGEAISSFLESDGAKAQASSIRASQDAVVAKIRALDGPAMRIANSGVKVVSQWTNVVNAVAVRIPYGYLSEIRKIDGVKRAYVQHIYSAPEPMEGTGNGGYSYDMVGLQTAWEAGFTGQGMVVAILDTGLDLEFATYWDPEENTNVSKIRHTHEAFRQDSFKNLSEANEFVRFNKGGMLDKLDTLGDSLNALRLSPSGVAGAIYKNLKVPFAYDYAGDVDPNTGELLRGDVNVYPDPETGSDHGTHVAGTVAGYAVDEEGKVIFSGVAPDAQILAMKVFDDTGAMGAESYLLNALEDAMTLGADVVNMSLGSDNGFSFDDTTQMEVCDTLQKAGVIMMTSAGNSYYSTRDNNRNGYNLSSDPDISMVSSPSVYDSNLSVAAINSTVQSYPYLHWSADGEDHEAAFSDPYSVAMRSKFTDEYIGEGIKIIPVDGVGTGDDYFNAGFRSYWGYGERGETGIALVKRGDISFADKVNNATQYAWTAYEQGQQVSGGVLAVLIYDSDPNSTELISMGVDGTMLTSAFISGVDGAAIVEACKAGKEVYLTQVEEQDRVTDWALAGQMSEFTSWGAGPGLELKPEITAPGGNIWSSVFDTSYNRGVGTYDDYDGSYAMMSGTSMAAPHMTGLAALVKQYIKESLPSVSVDARDELTNQLLVSTALPQKQTDGETYYSPRRQGAGLANVGGAVTTPAYITVTDQLVGKLELGDDVSWSGSFPYSFDVNNLTDQDQSYEATLVIQRPATGKLEDGRDTILDSDVLMRIASLGTITVPASGKETVNGTISLTGSEISALQSLFANGTFIEGYIILTDPNGTNPQIGLPFLGFLGDWTSAPIFDSATWLDAAEGLNEEGEIEESLWNNDVTWMSSSVGSADQYSAYNLGQNVFDGTSEMTQNKYYPENITISPGTGVIPVINEFILYQLRDAKAIVLEVRDAESNELYYHDVEAYLTRTLYYSSYEAAIPTSYMYMTQQWAGTDLEGNQLPNGTECIFTITAYGDGEYPMVDANGEYYTDFDAIDPTDADKEPTFNGHAMDKTGDVISFPVLVDTEAPKLENSAITCYEKDGKIYVKGNFTDGGSLASVAIYPQVARSYNLDYNPYADPDYVEYRMDRDTPFYSELIWDPDVQEWTFEADVTDYTHAESFPGENQIYNFEWTGNIYIFGGDYGGNDRGYAAHVDTTEGLSISPSSGLLRIYSEEEKDSFDLEVVNNTGSDAPLTYTSDNPDVATVDEFGHVEAVAPGQATITVTNGTETAVCIVAVENAPTEVLDFDLSIDHFETMKPDGGLVVNVENLYPADVVLDEIRWEVVEDDATAEYYEGLVNVSRYTTDGLSGQIFLNYDTYDTQDPSNPIPGGSGTLTVTLNGVSRSMTFKWADLYTSDTQDGLISDANYYGDQTIYVTQGETAALVAKYRQSNSHDVLPVALCTDQGLDPYGNNNPMDPAVGLKLDGPMFTSPGASWEGTLVAEPGYELPESIRIFTHYDYGTYTNEVEKQNYQGSPAAYTYDPETGKIFVAYSPYGSENTMVIRASGVETPGAAGGEMSGVTYETPDGVYGPFDWTFVSGTQGELEPFEDVMLNNTLKKGAYFTPSEPGVSFIRATNRDGDSVDFAVICEPVQADRIAVAEELGEGSSEEAVLDGNNLEMNVDDIAKAQILFTPEPTLEEDEELIWTSYNEDVATVEADGTITAHAPGYAYIKAAVKNNTSVSTYIVVHVLGEVAAQHAVTFIADGQIVAVKYVDDGYILLDSDYPEVPEKEGYTGEWEKYTDPVKEDISIEAVYTKNPDTGDPDDPDDPDNPDNPDNPPTEDDYVVTVDGGWTTGTTEGLTFTVKGDLSGLSKVYVDGVEVSASDYTVNEDGTLTLSPQFLSGLSAGTHILRLVFADGEATVDFVVTAAGEPSNPQPGGTTDQPGGQTGGNTGGNTGKPSAGSQPGGNTGKPSGNAKNNGTANTADVQQPMVWASLILLSVCGMALILFTARKKQNR